MESTNKLESNSNEGTSNETKESNADWTDRQRASKATHKQRMPFEWKLSWNATHMQQQDLRMEVKLQRECNEFTKGASKGGLDLKPGC